VVKGGEDLKQRPVQVTLGRGFSTSSGICLKAWVCQINDRGFKYRTSAMLGVLGVGTERRTKLSAEANKKPSSW